MAIPPQDLITPQFVDQLKQQPSLPQDSWYVVSAAVLCALNRPDEVANLFKYAIENAPTLSERQKIATRYREALIKVVPISGMPKTIRALLALKAKTPKELLDRSDHKTFRTDFVQTPASEVFARGEKFFGTVYGDKAASLMNVLDSCGTPDLGASARLMYSFFQGNAGILSAKESMCVSFVGGIATDVQDVVLNHMRGAINHGATKEEVNAVRQLAILICNRAGMKTNGGGWRTDIARL